MKSHVLWMFSLVGLLSLVVAGDSMAQSQGTIEIRQNILQQQKAAIEQQLKEAQRCIQNATNSQVARDPEGNINRVPKIDATNCARTAAALTRTLASLGRQAAQLERDAKVMADASKRGLIERQKARLRDAAQQQ